MGARQSAEIKKARKLIAEAVADSRRPQYAAVARAVGLTKGAVTNDARCRELLAAVGGPGREREPSDRMKKALRLLQANPAMKKVDVARESGISTSQLRAYLNKQKQKEAAKHETA